MSLEKIITTLKKPKEEMSMISINIPLSLKGQLAGIAKEHGFTTNAFLVAMIDDVLNGDARDKTNLETVEKLENLYAREKEIESLFIDRDSHMYFDSPEREKQYESELKNISNMIKILKEI